MLGGIFLPRVLVAYREQGILRRLSTTPIPPSWLLAAQVILNLCLAVIGIATLTIAGIAALGLSAPKDLFGYLLVCLLTITSLFAVGLCIAAVAKNNGIANAMAGLLFYLMLFAGGLWIPLQIMPRLLRDICLWTPLSASVSGIQNAMQGNFPTAQSLLCLVGYTIIFGYLAVRYFRWE
jgi:ABC-2 type transport system permease protein